MFLLLVLLIVVGTSGAFILAGHGFGTLGRIGTRAADRRTRLWCAAEILGAGAAAMYVWGALHLAGTVLEASDGGTGASPSRPCVTSGDGVDGADVIDDSIGLVPLRFVCQTADGGQYTVGSVPPYVNPAVPAFALPALACAVTAAVRNARAKPQLWPKPGGESAGD